MGRNQAVEILRIVAALGIVWFHAGAIGASFVHAGLAVFLILAAYFEARRETPRSVPQLFMRLMVPWAIWTAIFAAKNVVRDKPAIADMGDPVSSVLYGASPHLWFLPFILAALLVIGWLRAVLPKDVLASVFSIAAILLVTTPMFSEWSRELRNPWAEAAHGVVPVLIGAALGTMTRWSFLPVLMVLGVAFAAPAHGQTGYAIGLLAVLVAIHWPTEGRGSVDVTWLSGAMFGVYLVHPLALGLLKPAIGFVAGGVPLTIGAFVLSVGAVLAYRMAVKRLLSARREAPVAR